MASEKMTRAEFEELSQRYSLSDDPDDLGVVPFSEYEKEDAKFKEEQEKTKNNS